MTLHGRILLWMCALVVAAMPAARADGALPADFQAQHRPSGAALIRIKAIETRLRVNPEVGETFYYQTITADVEALYGAVSGVQKGASVVFTRPDFRTLKRDRMVMVGEEDVVFLSPTSPVERRELQAEWYVERDDLVPVVDGRFAWKGQTWPVAGLDAALRTPLRASAVVDPIVRLQLAEDFALQKRGGLEAADVVTALAALVRNPDEEMKHASSRTDASGTPLDAWLLRSRALQALGWLVKRDAKMQPAVVEALTACLGQPAAWSSGLHFEPSADGVTLVGSSRGPFEVAVFLASMDSAAGRDILWQAVQARDFAATADPEQPNASYGDPDDASSRIVAARALGRLGDARLLALTDQKLFLAGLRDFKTARPDEVRAVLVEWLKKPRGAGDILQDPWFVSRSVLARLGDDAALREILAKWDESMVLDANLGAIDRKRLHRIAAETGMGQAVQVAFPDPTAPAPSPRRPRMTPAERDQAITDDFGAADVERRCTAVRAAGRYQVAALYDRVVQVALGGSTTERRAAVGALTMYARPVPADALKQLLVADDLTVRAMALDLATAEEGPAHADEALAICRAVAAASKSGTDPMMIPGYETVVAVLPRLLQGGVPPAWLQGLDDSDPRVRGIYARAAVLCGVPALRPAMERHAADPDPVVRRSVQTYLETTPR